MIAQTFRLVLSLTAIVLPTAAAQTVAKAPLPTLPGLQTGTAPWPREVEQLTARLEAIGLPAMPKEEFVQHIHQHLTITIRGRETPVPAMIGVNEFENYISPIHTHKTDGIIHIEAANKDAFTLGQFFDVWGVRLTAKCIGGYCTKGADSLKVLSNAAPVTGDPRGLVLQNNQQIEIVFGPKPRGPYPKSKPLK
jgi:hypothetical protein